MPGPKYLDAIYDLAIEHDGYFTVLEAKSARIPPRQIAQMARRGTIDRISRGLYRLRNFPVPADRAQLWESVLWVQQRSGDPVGVLSHQTALSIWGLSDASPMRIHITLPRSERLRRNPPALMQIHFSDLQQADVTSHEGLPVTSVRRSLLDCSNDGESRFALEALDDALRMKLLTASEGRELKTLLT